MGNEKKLDFFEKLNSINVNEYKEEKEGLTYLSWVYAWAETMKIYPDATYKIWRFGDNDLPYVYDPNTGYMVFTSVTIEGITREMWLPVMDSKNKAMKAEPYTYTVNYGAKAVEKTVAAATMFDINKTIMRCLVKNLAMFGLGLYIFAGEDLPETEKPQKITEEQANILKNTLKDLDVTEENLQKSLKNYGVTKIEDLDTKQYGEILIKLNKNK
jgi:hypothetical protein